MDVRDRLQLLPGTKKRLGIKVRGENRFLYIGSAILGATLVTMFAFGRYESSLQSRVEQLNTQIADFEKTRNKNEEQNLRLVKERIETANRLLDGHFYWSKALDTVVGLLQSEVRFKSFAGDVTTGKISINVQALNYAVLAKQIASFLTEESISNFTLSKITPAASGILETGIEINFNKERLLQKK